MKTAFTIQGRQLTADDLSAIRDIIAGNPGWHRTRISQELCRRWHWVNDKGILKDIAARSMLRKLDSMGLIELPAPVRSANNEFRNQSVVPELPEQARSLIAGSLSDFQPIRIKGVNNPEDTRLFRGLLQQHHYLGVYAYLDIPARSARTSSICFMTAKIVCLAACCTVRQPGKWQTEITISAGMRLPANEICPALLITCDF